MRVPCPPATTSALTLLLALGLTACGTADEPAVSAPQSDKGMSASLRLADGGEAGKVEVAFTEDDTTLSVQATGLPPGLHGFHLHKTGSCEPDSADPAKPAMKGAFLSAAGHVAEVAQSHGSHDGDLPSLLVRGDGTARLVVTTDRLTRANVLDSDGSAVMVHEKPDNFGNVPTRYAPTLDDTTKKTGDAGPRIACAVLKG